ncbi:MAG: glycosyltransferase [Myxococcales bacterium FL481]|nr:MAG: glycosyltransferase [Myxococcales bacterium FL481]
MKVLMLGWEFPPHISGGLGTACYGLTRGLHEHGVEVVFVVPRRFGDEDRRFLTVVGCNDARTPIREGQVPSPAQPPRQGGAPASPSPSSGTPASVAAASGVAPESAPAGTNVATFVPVDSSLYAYATETTYHAGEPDVARRRVISEPERRTNREPPPEPVGAVDNRVPTAAPLSRQFLSGRYGHNLLHEVARYRDIVTEIAASHEFDVIHAHDWMTYPAAAALRARYRRPLVVHLHATEYDRSPNGPNHAICDLERAGLLSADRVICVSQYTASIAERRYGIDPAKLRVVYNAVVPPRASRSDNPRTLHAPLVLFLGRVTQQKGPEFFLRAARRVVDAKPSARFVMAGSGDMLVSMIEESARLGLAENFHFTGFLTGTDVERMYAMADVYVMPSVSEPFGIAPLEAMALDTPVIVSRQSGVSEVLNNALKVDFWDVERLASYILALLDEPALRQEIVARGRQELRTMQWSARGEHVLQIYRELVP